MSSDILQELARKERRHRMARRVAARKKGRRGASTPKAAKPKRTHTQRKGVAKPRKPQSRKPVRDPGQPGAKRMFTRTQHHHIKVMRESGMSVIAIAKFYDVDRKTIYNYLGRPLPPCTCYACLRVAHTQQ